MTTERRWRVSVIMPSDPSHPVEVVGHGAKFAAKQVLDAIDALEQLDADGLIESPVIIVSDDVGTGVVAIDPRDRRTRDATENELALARAGGFQHIEAARIAYGLDAMLADIRGNMEVYGQCGARDEATQARCAEPAVWAIWWGERASGIAGSVCCEKHKAIDEEKAKAEGVKVGELIHFERIQPEAVN